MRKYLISFSEENAEKVLSILKNLESDQLIQLKEYSEPNIKVSEDQIDEMIDESELGPYYTEEEARKILKI